MQLMSYQQMERFLDYAFGYDVPLDDNDVDFIEECYNKALSLCDEPIKSYLRDYTYETMWLSLTLHYCIVDPRNSSSSSKLNGTYKQYDIANKDVIVSSVSSGGSSSSIQTFKTFENGELLLMDLFRTPFGKYAYSILEQLKGVAVVGL